MTRFRLIATVLAMLSAYVAAATDTLVSKITAVTVFTDRAQVTRVASVKVAAGDQDVLFGNLPEAIDPNSIQVSGTGNAVVKDVKFSVEYLISIPDEKRRGLEERRVRLTDSITQSDDRIRQAQTERSFVDGIARKLTDPAEKNTAIELDPDKWAKMVAYYRSRQTALDNEVRDTEKLKRMLNERLAQLNQEISQIAGTNQKRRSRVSVVLGAKTDGKVALELSYIVAGPSWYPTYDVRVNTETKKLAVVYNALITQNTLEAWDGVTVRLSTARPMVSGVQPELQPWYVSIQPPYQQSMGYLSRAKRAEAPAPASMANQMMMEEDKSMEAPVEAPAPELEIAGSSVESNATAVVFAVNGTNTIESDNQPHKVTITQQEFPAAFRYSSVPKLAPYAYLKAQVTNNSDYVFLAGDANVFLGNSFVATSRLSNVAPGEEFWTFLGIDEGINVQYKLIRKFTKDEGLMGKRLKTTYEYLTVIKNNKKSSEDLVIWDQIPISSDQAVEVSLIDPAYKADTDVLKKNEQNFFEWRFSLKSGDEVRVPFKFSMAYPKGQILVGAP